MTFAALWALWGAVGRAPVRSSCLFVGYRWLSTGIGSAVVIPDLRTAGLGLVDPTPRIHL
jgi:hypothetical protein